MQQSILSVAINLALLLLFWRAVQRDARGGFYFNPILATPNRWIDRFLEFLSPVLPGVPARGVPIIALLFLLLFRGALLFSVREPRSIVIGSSFACLFDTSWHSAVLYSVLDFAAFVIRFWGFVFLVDLLGWPGLRGRFPEALRDFSRPTSHLPLPWRALVLFCANAVLCLALMRSTASSGNPFHPAAQHLSLPLLSMLDALLFLRTALIASWFLQILSILFQNPGAVQLFSEFQDTLLGRLASRRFCLGAFNFTPLIFLFALEFCHRLLVTLIRHAAQLT